MIIPKNTYHLILTNKEEYILNYSQFNYVNQLISNKILVVIRLENLGNKALTIIPINTIYQVYIKENKLTLLEKIKNWL